MCRGTYDISLERHNILLYYRDMEAKGGDLCQGEKRIYLKVLQRIYFQ